jgi:hypothetical protein
MPSYTLNDYQSIKGPFTLQQSVLEIIGELAKKFGGLIQTEQIRPKPKPKNGYRTASSFSGSNDESWQTMRDFKATVVLDKQNKSNDIRVALNKLSAKTYDTTSELIIEKLKDIINSENEEEIQKTITTIYDTISTNKMFSAIYAQFYKNLIETFPDLFSPILIPNNFIESISVLRYADPNTNYDEFCAYNKENDKRKATALFITNLVAIDAMPLSELFFLTNSLLAMVNRFIKEQNKTNEVEEITENIYILLTSNKLILDKLPEDIKTNVEEIAKMKLKEWPSISSRCIFKYVDIVEKLYK